MYGPLIFLTILSACIGIVVWRYARHQKNTKNGDSVESETSKSKFLLNSQNYIKPAEFEVGFLKQNKFKSMGNCNPDVLYPINGLGPDYGWKMPENCPCTQFVQPP
jgi:hypothetical protein